MVEYGGKEEKMSINMITIVYGKRRTIAVEVRRDVILVQALKGMGKRKINAFLYEKRDWIENHLEKMQKQQSTLAELDPFTMD